MPNPDTLVDQGLRQLEAGRYKQAEATFRKVVQLYGAEGDKDGRLYAANFLGQALRANALKLPSQQHLQ